MAAERDRHRDWAALLLFLAAVAFALVVAWQLGLNRVYHHLTQHSVPTSSVRAKPTGTTFPNHIPPTTTTPTTAQIVPIPDNANCSNCPQFGPAPPGP